MLGLSILFCAGGAWWSTWVLLLSFRFGMLRRGGMVVRARGVQMRGVNAVCLEMCPPIPLLACRWRLLLALSGR